MSERTRGSHTSGAHHEAHDLKNLHTSKTQESLRNEITDAANTDLSSASIQSISVVRLSARPEKRKLGSTDVLTPRELDPSTEQKQRQRSGHQRGQSFGILKNPYFRYQGDPLARLITLFANLLKYLERLLIASPPIQTPQPPKTIVKTKKRDASGREIDDDAEEGTPPLGTSPR